MQNITLAPTPLTPALSGDRDGATFDRARDGKRLNGAMLRVYLVMADRQWHTLADLAQRFRMSEASASARLRDLRKARFGGFTVERRNMGGGIWTYRLAEAPAA